MIKVTNLDLNLTSFPLIFLPQPTLIMAGTDNLIVAVANQLILASLIPDARLVTIDFRW